MNSREKEYLCLLIHYYIELTRNSGYRLQVIFKISTIIMRSTLYKMSWEIIHKNVSKKASNFYQINVSHATVFITDESPFIIDAKAVGVYENRTGNLNKSRW